MTTALFRVTAQFAVLSMLVAATSAAAQDPHPPVSHIVVPPLHGFSTRPGEQAITVEGLHATVRIEGHVAHTALDIKVHNPGTRRAEAVILQPLPRGAAVSGFAFEGPASEPTARLLPHDEARRIYNEIVRQVRDPAILEFAGYNLVRSSVFPVEPGQSQRVRLEWDEVLGGDGARLDYILPRSSSITHGAPFQATVTVQTEEPIASIYSPSHQIQIEKTDRHHATISIGRADADTPGAFHLSILQAAAAIPTSIFAYPDPSIGGGYFLLIAGAPKNDSAENSNVPREVTIVLDRSGSMAGEKMDQARAAALQVVESLGPRDAFNIIDYSTTVSSLFDRPRSREETPGNPARRYLDELRTNGGTNLHDALLEGLRAERAAGTGVPIMLFLTDGLPTVGRTSESTIRALLESGNTHNRRLFTFGVGTDVNAPLLDRIADLSRGFTTYVLPGQDVETAVSALARRLGGPVMWDTTMNAERIGTNWQTAGSPIHDVLPATVPDLYDGEHLVLLGTWRGDEPIQFELEGTAGENTMRQVISFDPATAATRNDFVPRLWATRQIATLVDAIRQAGSDQTSGAESPQNQELIDEIVRLSTRFGVLTEYTAFLAEEGTNLGEWNDLVLGCRAVIDERAVQTRSGAGAVNQGINYNSSKQQEVLNLRNRWVDSDLAVTEVTGVQQCGDRALFRRANQWVDSKLIVPDTNLTPDETVEWGSDRHLAIVHALADTGRQGLLSVHGDVLLAFDGHVILIKGIPS